MKPEYVGVINCQWDSIRKAQPNNFGSCGPGRNQLTAKAWAKAVQEQGKRSTAETRLSDVVRETYQIKDLLKPSNHSPLTPLENAIPPNCIVI